MDLLNVLVRLIYGKPHTGAPVCGVPLEHQYAVLCATRAVMNLSGHATTWFRCTGVNPGTITWEQLSYELRRAFRSADFDQWARDRLE